MSNLRQHMSARDCATIRLELQMCLPEFFAQVNILTFARVIYNEKTLFLCLLSFLFIPFSNSSHINETIRGNTLGGFD